MEDTFTRSTRLRIEIENLQKDIRDAQGSLKRIEDTCQHNWSPTKADHIYHEGYHDPGDPPGTMGVDRQLPMDVPAKTIERWKRVCLRCGKTEYTKRTEDEVTKIPKFGRE